MAGGSDDWLQRIRSLHQDELGSTPETEPSDESPQLSLLDSSWDDETPDSDDNDIPDWFNRFQEPANAR